MTFMLSQEFITEMKTALLAHQERLQQELAGLSVHTEVGEDYDENATEIQIDEVSHDVSARIKSDLEKITAALQRIEAGTYGVDDSGAEISEDRLRALPWADKAI